MKLIYLLSLLTLAVPMAMKASAEDALNPSYRLCRLDGGDYGDISKCGPIDGVVPPSIEDGQVAAANTCNIHTPSGLVTIPHNQAVLLSTVSGGRNGFSTWQFNCHYPPGTKILFETETQPVYEPISELDIALAACRKAGVSADKVSWFLTWNKDFGGHGERKIKLRCYQ